MSADADGGERLAHPIVPVLIGIVLVVGGGYLYYSEMQATANSEPIDATVVASGVVDTDTTGASENANDYTVTVEYRYTYDGDTYTSESLCPGAGSACKPSSDFRSDMRDVLADYPEGETVTAYVQPSNPERAYLIRSGPSLIYLGVAAVGVLLTGLGVRRLLVE